MTDRADKDRPKWWIENERLRQVMGLPPYDPPRFSDSVFTHEVVPELEEKYGCKIQFVALNPRYPDDWSVRVDREMLMTIGRQRNKNGNTIYEMTAEEFRNNLEQKIRERECEME